MTALEIAVQDPAGAEIARAGGADRVELCSALGATGGLTPTLASVEAAVATGIEVHALVRTRPGGFVYDPAEIAVMAADIVHLVSAGAAGVVVGALHADGSVDRDATAVLTAAARRAGDVQVTFHRALDAAADPVDALQTLADLGVTRVLTSGGAQTAQDGLAVLSALVAADTGVQIMAGGGVRPDIIGALVDVGVDAVHLSAKTMVDDPGSAGPGGGSAVGLETTDPAIVAAARRATLMRRGSRP
ncbi:copper homeostasis protein CutC [Gordonia sp. HY442]|uniref:copper homeostasis protein CutC n=1 Tax=Gordonia zhenghanii TaxID=2911516 RepID=UPI001F225B4D|nr:copper homeostasis protein CutC [Gordonia zhenghanii]MCF8605784.1 copper homeostasis protein CutC [Gordonia zhenghanii]